MKLFEFKYDLKTGITIKRESEQSLTAEQKYNLLMGAIICTAACFIMSLFFGLFH